MGINATVTGRLGKTPELIQFDGGQALKLSVASDSSRKVNGQRVKVTDWISVIFFGGPRALSLHEMNLEPGTKVAIPGSLTMREYEVEGEKRHQLDMQAYDVELMGGKRPDDAGKPANKPAAKPANKPANGGRTQQTKGRNSDDIPF